MITREEEIKQKAKEIASNWDDGRGNVFYHRVDMLCNMARWADEHPKNPTCSVLNCLSRNGEYVRTDNSHVIANLQAEIERLKNPWRDARKDPPKEGVLVIYMCDDGKVYCGCYDSYFGTYDTQTPDGEIWSMASVIYWMPKPERPKGGTNYDQEEITKEE